MVTFPVLLINLLSIFMLAAVIWAVWKVRSKQLTKPLLTTCLFLLIWALGSFAEMVSPTFALKVFFRDVTQIGVFFCPVATLSFVLSYTGYFPKKKSFLLLALYGLQTLALLLIMTDGLHHWIRSGIGLVQTRYYQTIVVESTPLAKFLIAGNVFLMVFSIVLVFFFSFTTSGSMRRQTYSVLLGIVIPLVYALLKVSSKEQFLQLLPISGFFAISSVFMLVGIHRFDLLTLAPLAREQVFHFLGEGIVISSPDGKILDANAAAKDVLGKSLEEIERTLNLVVPLYTHMVLEGKEQLFTFSLGERSFSAQIFPITDRKTEVLGSIILIQDVSALKKQAQLLRKRAEIDGLTGLYNRQTFIEQVERILDGNIGQAHLLSFDLDHFKAVNDGYGHRTGDVVLETIGKITSELFDDSFLKGRFGGEEFSVFSSTATRAEMLSLAEALRKKVAAYSVPAGEKEVVVTISLGLATMEKPSFDALYLEADRLLYAAKKAGRNCLKA